MVVTTEREKRFGLLGDGGPTVVVLKRGESRIRERRKRDEENERERGDERLKKEREKRKKKADILGIKL